MSPSSGPAPALVVVGASAGGVEALQALVAGLPADFAGCVLVVLHVPATSSSALPQILDRAGPLPARHAREGDLLTGGQILVAPPGRHLVVLGDSVALTRGPQENGHRPAVDVLFRSAARAWGARVVSVVLSGSLDDGAAGTVAVRSRGGLCLVQDFDEALYDGMPRSAAAAGAVEDTVPVTKMGAVLTEFVASPVLAEAQAVTPLMDMETQMADLDPEAMHGTERPGSPAGFGCPDCAGALYQIDEGDLRRYRCRVGHAWSPESLLDRQALGLESALWMALRSLEEKAALNADLGQRASMRGAERTATRFEENAQEAWRAAELVRRLVVELGGGASDPDEARTAL